MLEIGARITYVNASEQFSLKLSQMICFLFYLYACQGPLDIHTKKESLRTPLTTTAYV